MSVGSLIGLAGKALDDGGYADWTRRAYKSVWRDFEGFCLSEGRGEPTRADGASFLASVGCPAVGGTSWDRFKRRAVRRLFAVGEPGGFGTAAPRSRVEAPACFAAVHDAYAESLSDRALSASTRAGKEGLSRQFLASVAACGVFDVAALNPGDVFSYLAGPPALAASTRSQRLFFLREYLRFLVARFGADAALGGLFPVVPTNNDEVLPSVFTPDEVRRALAALDPSSRTARRDRAVLLLAAQLGLRAGDIRGLRFDEVDWRLGRVSLIQHKTGARIDLPLPDECRYALLDYWRNERPDRPDPQVFLGARAPFAPHSSAAGFGRLVASCFERAGVDASGRHHGLHSLRHSAAVAMLTAGATLPAVSAALGHASSQTTMRYLRVDIETLRAAALEVPRV
ncbi:MAG: tyrosine-type recombinase/integrase [Bifidobacteriaceae bacterium]|nr:tyrosine-type recombinase/integrase [Bifidobacteriaceae bacterium]